MKLLNIDANPKTVKGQAHGYMTAVLYLAPWKLSGINVCPTAELAGCWRSCLNTAGRAGIPSSAAPLHVAGSAVPLPNVPNNAIQRARIARTRFFHEDRAAFIEQLCTEIAAFVRTAERKGFKPCVRLNGTSDLPWENLGGEPLKAYGGRIVDAPTAPQLWLLRQGDDWWSNKIGWTEHVSDATRFTQHEKDTFAQPLGAGVHWVEDDPESLPQHDEPEVRNLPDLFPNVQFYDYTKLPSRLHGSRLPANYHLSISWSGHDTGYARKAEAIAYETGAPLVVVTRSGYACDHDKLPQVGAQHIVDGDEHDLRFLHEPNTLVVLKAKGAARKESNGFVLEI